MFLMKLERRFAKLENPNKVVGLIVDSWKNQDSVLVMPYEENKIVYISKCDDLNDSYHGQGLLVKAHNYASIYDYVPTIIEEFNHMKKDVEKLSDCNIEKAEVKDRCDKIIKELSVFNPNNF